MKQTPDKSAQEEKERSKSYDRLSEKSKDLLSLQDQIDESTGKEEVALHEKVREKTG